MLYFEFYCLLLIVVFFIFLLPSFGSWSIVIWTWHWPEWFEIHIFHETNWKKCEWEDGMDRKKIRNKNKNIEWLNECVILFLKKNKREPTPSVKTKRKRKKMNKLKCIYVKQKIFNMILSLHIHLNWHQWYHSSGHNVDEGCVKLPLKNQTKNETKNHFLPSISIEN